MRLNEDQTDALTEVINIGVGRAASTLYSLIDQRIELRVPKIVLCDEKQLREELAKNPKSLDTSVGQEFSGTISGKALLAFPKASGTTLAKLLSDPDIEEDELESDLAGILEEIGNIFLNSVLGSIANLFEDDFAYTVPEVHDGAPIAALLDGPQREAPRELLYLMADAQFEVADSEIKGSLLLVFNTPEFQSLIDNMLLSA